MIIDVSKTCIGGDRSRIKDAIDKGKEPFKNDKDTIAGRYSGISRPGPGGGGAAAALGKGDGHGHGTGDGNGNTILGSGNIILGSGNSVGDGNDVGDNNNMGSNNQLGDGGGINNNDVNDFDPGVQAQWPCKQANATPLYRFFRFS